MTSPDPADSGLLSPVVAGTAVEAVTGDAAVLRALLDAEAALTRALARLGLAPRAAAEAVDAVDPAAFDVRDLALRARAGGNPVIPFVKDLKAAVGPEAAPYVHRGATSQDILDTALMLVARRALAPILTDLTATAETLRALAARHRNTPMPGRTLTQHAVPTTFGLKAAGWRHLVLDAHTRLRAVERTLPAQLGGAAGTLSAFPLPTRNPNDTTSAPATPTVPHSGSDGPVSTLDAPNTEHGGATGTSEAVINAEHGGATGAPEAVTNAEHGNVTGAPEAAGDTKRGGATDAPGAVTDAERGRVTDAPGAVTDAKREGVTGAAGAFAGTEPGEPVGGLVGVYAVEVGLKVPLLPWHVLRTPVADLGAALAFVGGALGKVAADVLVLARTEVAEVAEGGGGGSSAMPHKSNPVRATLISAAARRLPGLAAELLGALAAEDERPAGAWHAEWQPLREALRLAGGAAEAARELAEGLVVRPEKMRADLDLTHGLIVSERAAAELAGSLGRERARALLEEASARAAATGTPLADAVAALLPEGVAAFDPDPTTYLGAAAALVDAALTREADS
ncbi:lyase family protein [Actinocorallia sp. A-T 12471]|uniref:lyase family protein n=1 Tax=Actinocorallia sp. A-T 12471 TaxID=3089813 RepID=UPI0029D262BC|nr:lyase family protein [Actinocorallia sp. A-T 12471]MDX6740392.1 lyase family protein [Actinocorallia sp. A-T 12471]